MCSLTTEAPALVPPTTTPSAYICRTVSPSAVPRSTAASRAWLPPVKKIPVAPWTAFEATVASASARLTGRTDSTSAAPKSRNTLS